MTIDQDERARRRDERERQTIAALALIAPSPELVRRVIELELPEAEPLDVVRDAATDIEQPLGAAPNL